MAAGKPMAAGKRTAAENSGDTRKTTGGRRQAATTGGGTADSGLVEAGKATPAGCRRRGRRVHTHEPARANLDGVRGVPPVRWGPHSGAAWSLPSGWDDEEEGGDVAE